MTLRNAIAAVVCATVALLPACVGPRQTIPVALLPGELLAPDLGISKEDLLYVSNANAEVTVYRYWKQTLVTVLTDFSQPMGECVDGSDNVYIADHGAQRILEYAHGGTKPIKTFNDSPDSPYACYVDAITGKLAVANDDGTSRAGNIAIWTPGSSTPVKYADPQISKFDGCAFDGKGNLLVTSGSINYNEPALFAWLPKGGATLINIKVPGPQPSWSWYYINGIEWDGKYFVIGYYDTLARIALLHGQAYYVSSSTVYQSATGPYWFYNNTPGSQATEVVGGYDGRGYSYVNYWAYPAGGNPIAQLSHGVDQPFAVTISYKHLSH